MSFPFSSNTAVCGLQIPVHYIWWWVYLKRTADMAPYNISSISFLFLIDKHRAAPLGWLLQSKCWGQKAHVIMIVSILSFLCYTIVIKAIFPLKCVRRIVGEAKRLQSLKWKLWLNRRMLWMQLLLQTLCIYLFIIHWPVCFCDFTGTQNVSPVTFPLTERDYMIEQERHHRSDYNIWTIWPNDKKINHTKDRNIVPPKLVYLTWWRKIHCAIHRQQWHKVRQLVDYVSLCVLYTVDFYF